MLTLATATVSITWPDAVVEAGGEFDVSNVSMLEHALDEAMQLTRRDVVVDLSEVRCVDATALRAVQRAQTKVRARGGRLVVVNPSPMFEALRFAN
jgi:anti-sigma B factor antagonist